MTIMTERQPDELTQLIQRALKEGPFTLQQLALDAGISYDSLYSWAKGRRVPRTENLQQLVVGFQRRIAVLHDIANALRDAADPERSGVSENSNTEGRSDAVQPLRR
jgi:predicted transcriptional regulator